MARGRHGIDIDISQLAEFVTTVKTTVLSKDEFGPLEKWASSLAQQINIHRASATLADYDERGYYKHLDHRSRWRLRKAIEQGLYSAQQLNSPRLEQFARCVVLRTAQWALDGRKKLPSTAEFRECLVNNAIDMIAAGRKFRAAATAHARAPTVRVFNCSAAGIDKDQRIASLPAPKLVVTSPPYPGIHVLYHRWQVDGRKEAPLPFMIAGKLDGAGSSYYTMGDRKYPELATYFANIEATMSSVAVLADKNTVVVQMLAFSEATWQLPRYLETMEEAGFTELFLPSLKNEADGRLWRSVPGRRWYSDQRGDTPGSREVVLFHRKAASMRPRPRQPIGVRAFL
jgi:hypothetical protein